MQRICAIFWELIVLSGVPCSNAGGISKQDLRRFLLWGATHLGYPALAEVEAAREWRRSTPGPESVPSLCWSACSCCLMGFQDRYASCRLRCSPHRRAGAAEGWRRGADR